MEFPHNIINNNLNPTRFSSCLDEEVQMMIQDINIDREKIVETSKERVQFERLKTGIEAAGKITLCDVFEVVDRGKYPLLWKEVIKMKTIMPTSLL